DGAAAAERQRNRIADAAVGETVLAFAADDRHRRKQMRDRRARADNGVQGRAAIAARREILGLSGGHVVADNAETLHAVMQPVEARRLELLQAMWNHAAPSVQ